MPTDLSIADERIKRMGEESLERVRAKIKELKPRYEVALEAAGGPELSPKVQALVDQVLRYDGSQGPHGAIWHLAKAHTLALELVAPQAAIEEHDTLVKREQAILVALKAAAKGDENAAEALNKFFDETGRPLQ